MLNPNRSGLLGSLSQLSRAVTNAVHHEVGNDTTRPGTKPSGPSKSQGGQDVISGAREDSTSGRNSGNFPGGHASMAPVDHNGSIVSNVITKTDGCLPCDLIKFIESLFS